MTSPTMRTRVGRGLAALVVTAAFASLGAAPASAHSQLTSTSPTDGAVLEAPPAEVRLTFDSTLLDDTDTISINDNNGNVVKSIHPKPEGDSVAIPWPEGTAPGVYQVAYRVVCGDGHPVVGALSLTINGSGPAVGAAAAPAAAASTNASAVAIAVDQPPASGPSGSIVPIVAGAAVVGAAAVTLIVALLARRRQSASAQTTAS